MLTWVILCPPSSSLPPLSCRLSRSWRPRAWRESSTAVRRLRRWRRLWTSCSTTWRIRTSRTRTRTRSSRQPTFREPETRPGEAPAWLQSSQVTRLPPSLGGYSMSTSIILTFHSSYDILIPNRCTNRQSLMQKQSESVDYLLVSVASLSSAAIDVSAGDFQ